MREFQAMPGRSDEVARQFQALLERHRLAVGEVAKRVAEAGGDAVIVRRVLQGAAKTEPKPQTLRMIAQAVGESKEQAFPETGEPPPEVIRLVDVDDSINTSA